MSTDRLFMTSPAIDGRDEIEDYWLKNRDYVLSIPQVPHYIDFVNDELTLEGLHFRWLKCNAIEIGIR